MRLITHSVEYDKTLVHFDTLIRFGKWLLAINCPEMNRIKKKRSTRRNDVKQLTVLWRASNNNDTLWNNFGNGQRACREPQFA